MALSKDAYRALEDIVGPKYISDDPSICDSYAYQYLAETARPEQSHFMPRPVAAVLPATAEETQKIVQICNRYKIKVKAYSTGWYLFGAPQKDEDDTIQVDLRRMDRIIDIDEKNMFAVAEPYVICATLQAEAMKKGLNLNIIGAGASTSPVGNATSYLGTGPGTAWMGENSENLLGLEWVTPRGDIVRTGSLGSGAGWFCGEGPGPSLRGLCRGVRGARGGLGVYTKAGLKLTHWPGPPQFDVKGTIPAYHAPVPDILRVYTVGFPSWPAYADAQHKLLDNELGYIWHRQYAMMGTDLGPAFWMLYIDPTKTLNDLPEYAAKPEIKQLTEEMRRSFQFVMAGRSLRDIEFQDKVLDRILAETGGWKVARLSEKDMAEFTYLYMVRLGHKALNFAYTGGYLGSWTQKGPPEHVIRYVPIAEAGGYRDQASGLLAQCGGDSMMGPGGTFGGGGNAVLEQFIQYDNADKESIKAAIQHMHNATADAVKNGFAPGKETLYTQVPLTDEEVYEQYRKSPQPLAYRLQGKIKKLLDPNNIGDRMYSTLPE